MRWQFWQKQQQVLIVGYAAQNTGGVSSITNSLCDRIAYLKLHVALQYYRPRWKLLLFTIKSILLFLGRMLVSAPSVVQVVIGSRGDALRMLPFILLGYLRGCQICLHFHKNRAAILESYSLRLQSFVLQVWKLSNAFVFLSPSLQREFPELVNPDSLSLVIGNPIGEEWIKEKILPLEVRKRDLVFFGRWAQEKGADDLLPVLQDLDKRLSNWTCDFYTDVHPTGFPANCVFHDWLPADQVRQVLRQAKLLLLPSHAEAYPTVLMEAAACGTPFVSTSLPGVIDIASQSQAGLLHNVGDRKQMCQAIVTMLTDHELWKQHSINGRNWIATRDNDSILDQWHQLYLLLGIHPREQLQAA